MMVMVIWAAAGHIVIAMMLGMPAAEVHVMNTNDDNLRVGSGQYFSIIVIIMAVEVYNKYYIW